MQCFLCSPTAEDIQLPTSDSLKFHEATLSADFEEKLITLVTGSKPIVNNGFALKPNATYTLNEGDILKIDKNMAYTVQFSSKRFKPDTGTKKITSFFGLAAGSTTANVETPFTKITGTWNELRDHLVFIPEDNKPSTKIASFDLDGTLIKPKSGKKYPENYQDWTILFKSVPKTLLEYYNKDFKLVLFTNQLSVGSDHTKRQEFKQKIEDILNTIKLPMQVYVATQKDRMRKPCLGMWDALADCNENVKIDKTQSFYVGDAAGRPKKSTTPKDHSFTDMLFAKNLQIKFYIPEEFFMNGRHTPVKIPFEPKVTVKQNKFTLSEGPEVLLMVGAPASGKSTFTKRQLIPEGYVHVSRDDVGSWQKCIQLVNDALRRKVPVVVDNTNKDKESRKRFIDVAKSFKVPCRCFYMKVDKLRAMHNNKYRQLIDEKHAVVTDIIIHSYYKGFEEPMVEEGFDEIVELAFVPEFTDANCKHRELYEMYLLEKF